MKKELEYWYPLQCKNIYEDFYLWYRKTSKKKGDIVIAPNKPGKGFNTAYKINKALSPEGNLAVMRLYGIISKLPVLTND